MKPCSRCGVVKPLEAYSRSRRLKAGRRADCKACCAAYAKRYAAARPSETRARFKKWARENRDKLAANSRKYYAANRDRHQALITARRAKVRHAPGNGVTHEQRNRVLADSLGLCAYCNARAPLQVDHIDPIARGGAHDEGNLAAACGPCNKAKSNIPLLLWLARRATQRAA